MTDLAEPDERNAGPRFRSPFDPRLRFDRYLLVWNAPAPHELRRYEPVSVFHAEQIIERLLAHADEDTWDRLFEFYCRATHLHGLPLLQEHYDEIRQWLPRQLRGRLARAMLLERKPLEFTGRFVEEAPAPPAEEQSASEDTVYFEFVLRNKGGYPMPREAYEIQCSDGQVLRGRTDRNGHVGRDVPPGDCEVTFPNIKKPA